VNSKRFNILICLILPVFSSFGQNVELIDNIRKELRTADGRKKFELLNDLAWEYRFASQDTTISYANRAFQIGKALSLTSGLARPLNIMGVGFNYKGERLLAYEYYSQALTMGTAQNDSIQIAHANNNIGRLFFEQGLLGRSYQHFIKAKSIFQNINDSSGLAYIYQSLGNLYKVQHDYKKSEESFLKAYHIRLALGNTRDIMSALLYCGRLHQETGQWDKSIEYLKLADSTGQVIDDQINLAEIRTYLAESYLNVGMIREAESVTLQGLAVIEKLNNVRMKPQAYHMMGQIFLKKGALSKAEEYFASSLDVATKIKDLNSQMKAYYDLWKIAEKKGNEQQRLLSMNQYLILNDSMKDLDLARRVERLQFEIEIERKEQENIVLKAQDQVQQAVIQQQELQNIILIVIIGFVSIMGLMLWQNNKKRKEVNEHLVFQNDEIQKQREEIIRQNQKLSKRNQQLAELNHEKDTLMSIVAHDLKSPLNRIKGLTDLMELEGTLPNEHKIYVRMMKDATEAGLDLIIDLLDVHMLEENVEPTYAPFDLSKFLLEKIEEFMQAAEAKNIHLYITRVSSDEVYCDYDYLNRIMDNLLSNAIKFSERGSTVVVAADCLPDQFWISVKDHGPGFTSYDKQQLYQKFRKLTARPTGGETSNGLGLAIVKTLVDRLKGKIELSSEGGNGSEFIIRIPTAKELIQKPVE
jgi:signal transduction histidine kinase